MPRGLALLDFKLFGELDLLSWTSCLASGLLERDEALPLLLFGLSLPDLGLCDLVRGLREGDFGLPVLDFFGLPDRDLATGEPLCDLDFLLGDSDTLDLGLDEPDLLLCTDPDLLDLAGVFDLLRDDLCDDLRDDLRDDFLDWGEPLPDRAGLCDGDLKRFMKNIF